MGNSALKYECSTTKTRCAASAPPISKLQRVSNLSCAQCRCVSTKAGIRFNSTCLTSLVEPMGLITLKLFTYRSMQTVVYVEYNSRIVYTMKKNYLESLNCN